MGGQNLPAKISWDLGLNLKKNQAECRPFFSLEIKKNQPLLREEISQEGKRPRALSLFRLEYMAWDNLPGHPKKPLLSFDNRDKESEDFSANIPTPFNHSSDLRRARGQESRI